MDYQILSKLRVGLETPHSAGVSRFFRNPIGRIFFPGFIFIYEKLCDSFEEKIEERERRREEQEVKRLKRLQIEHLA